MAEKCNENTPNLISEINQNVGSWTCKACIHWIHSIICCLSFGQFQTKKNLFYLRSLFIHPSRATTSTPVMTAVSQIFVFITSWHWQMLCSRLRWLSVMLIQELCACSQMGAKFIWTAVYAFDSGPCGSICSLTPYQTTPWQIKFHSLPNDNNSTWPLLRTQ